MQACKHDGGVERFRMCSGPKVCSSTGGGAWWGHRSRKMGEGAEELVQVELQLPRC